MELVFKALGDPHRRALLDRLFRADGLTLGELSADLPMTRFGVAKHLRLLERAGLVVVQRDGRKKRHYLNPVPIRVIHDRWMGKYAEPRTAGLDRPTASPGRASMGTPARVYEVYIRTTAEQLWDAITNPDLTKQYFHGTIVESAWTPNAPVVHRRQADGQVALEGTVLEADPPRKLVTTFRFGHHAEGPTDRPSRITWTIEQNGDCCRLRLVHDDFDGETVTSRAFASGWNPVLSGLKTLLETGTPLKIG